MKVMLTKPTPAPEPLAVTEPVAARMLGVSPRCLWGMRRDGTGPRHFVVGRGGIRYAVEEVRRWVSERSAASTGEVSR